MKENFKNYSFILLVGLMVFTGIANLTASGTQDSENASADPIELSVITWRVEDAEYFEWAHEKFEQENPDIKLKFDAVPTAQWEQFKSARVATGEVDVFAVNPAELTDDYDSSLLLDLSGQDYLSNYFSDALEMSRGFDKQLMIPFSSVSVVTFYNKKIFKELGLSIPRTWSDFINVCNVIQESDTAPLIIGGKDQWPINMVLIGLEAGIVRGVNPEFYENMRSEKTQFTDREWVEVYSKLETLSQYYLKNSAGLGYGQVPGMFATGNAAMLIDGSWSKSQIIDANPDFEIGAFLTPGSDIAANNDILPIKIGGGWGIYSDSANKEAAQRYMAFISRKDIYKKFIELVKMTPVVKDVVLDEPLSNEIGSLTQNQTLLWELLGIPGAKYSHTDLGMKIFLGLLTPEEAAQKMQEDLINSKADWQ